MAYVAPERGEVDFKFFGDVYVPPTRGDVSFSYVQVQAGPSEASGFVTTSFGAPIAPGFYSATPVRKTTVVAGEATDAVLILHEDFSAPGSLLGREVFTGAFGPVTWGSTTAAGYSTTVSDGYLVAGSTADLTAFWTDLFTQPSPTLTLKIRIRGGVNRVGASKQFRCYLEYKSGDFDQGVFVKVTEYFGSTSAAVTIGEYSSSGLDLANGGMRDPLYASSQTNENLITFTVSPTRADLRIDGLEIISRTLVSPMPGIFNRLYIDGDSVDFGDIELLSVGYKSAEAPFVNFGLPSSYKSFKASSLGLLTKLGQVFTPVPRTLFAATFMAVKVGFPQRISLPFQPANTFVSAKGFKPTEVGTPASVSATAVQASGSTSTAFGTPTRPQFFAAEGFNTPALFGQASSSFSTRAAGFKATAYAAPTHRRTQSAASTYRAARWGVPVAERSNTFKTYGVNCSGRFGQPKGYQRFNYPVTGVYNTLFGTHTSFEMRRATMIPPTLQFGKPLLKRTPLC